MTVKALDLEDQNRFKMDILMNEFLDMIREDPRNRPYESRILKAFFQIDSEQSRSRTLCRVVDFMKNCLKEEMKKIDASTSNRLQIERFSPITEIDGAVRVVRHEDWPALLAHMPLEIIKNPSLTHIWYTPKLAFYLSDSLISSEELNAIRASCIRRRDRGQLTEKAPASSSSTNDSIRRSSPLQSSSSRDRFTCPICFDNYNQASRKPMIITNCGHTLCQTCVNRLADCPECRAPIQQTIVNFAFKEVIEGREYHNDEVNELKIRLSAQENERKATEEILKILQEELENKMALEKNRILDSDTFDAKVTQEQEVVARDKNRKEIEKLKREIAEIKKQHQVEVQKSAQTEANVARVEAGNKSKSLTITKALQRNYQYKLLIKGLPSNFSRRDVGEKVLLVCGKNIDGFGNICLMNRDTFQDCLVYLTNYEEAKKLQQIMSLIYKPFELTLSKISANERAYEATLREKIQTMTQSKNLDEVVAETTVLVSGLPVKKGVATKIFKDMQAAITDQKLKIQFVTPPTLGQALLRFDETESAIKFIKKYNHQTYGNTDCVMRIELFPGNSQQNLKPDENVSDTKISRGPSPIPRTQNPGFDRTKVYIQNLPSHTTAQSVIKWIFKDSPDLVQGSVHTRFVGGSQTCWAKFTNEEAVDKIIAEFNNCVYPGTDSTLRVRHDRLFDPNRSKSREPYRPPPSVGAPRLGGRPSYSPTRKQQNFRQITPNSPSSPMPKITNLKSKEEKANASSRNSSTTQQTTRTSQIPEQLTSFPSPIPIQMTVNPPIMQMPPPFFLQPMFYHPPPAYRPPINHSVQINQPSSPIVFVSNLPLGTSRADLIQFFHNITLEGELIQMDDDQGIQFLPSLQPNPSHKNCLITFKTTNAATLVQRYLSGRPFQHPENILKIEIRANNPPSNAQSNHFLARNLVKVQNLPSNVQINDLVEMFHPISKIAHDQDLRAKISLHPQPNASIEAVIDFQTSEGAERIAFLYRAHDFKGTGQIIQASLL